MRAYLLSILVLLAFVGASGSRVSASDINAVVLTSALPESFIGPVPPLEFAGAWPALHEIFNTRKINVLAPDTTDVEQFINALALLKDELEKDKPLIVILDGTLIEDDPVSWLSFGSEAEIFDTQLADKTLSTKYIVELADNVDAPVVIIINTQTDDLTANEVLKIFSPKQDGSLTVAMMDLNYVNDFIKKGLLRKGAALGALQSVLPGGASIAGALPLDQALSGSVDQKVISDIAYDQGIWVAYSEMNTPGSLKLYLEAQPDGIHATEAETRKYFLEYNSNLFAKQQEDDLNLTEDQRLLIQENLDFLGFFAGTIDGKWGKDTRAAIKEWQLWSQLPTTGYLQTDDLEILRKQVDREEERERQLFLDEERLEREYWIATGQRGSEQELRAYLDRYPNGVFSSIAHERLETLTKTLQEFRGGLILPEGSAPEKSLRPSVRQTVRETKDTTVETGQQSVAPKTDLDRQRNSARKPHPSSRGVSDSNQTFVEWLFGEPDQQNTQAETHTPSAVSPVVRPFKDPPKTTDLSASESDPIIILNFPEKKTKSDVGKSSSKVSRH